MCDTRKRNGDREVGMSPEVQSTNREARNCAAGYRRAGNCARRLREEIEARERFRKLKTPINRVCGLRSHGTGGYQCASNPSQQWPDSEWMCTSQQADIPSGSRYRETQRSGRFNEADGVWTDPATTW